jgi:hypothetical protein
MYPKVCLQARPRATARRSEPKASEIGTFASAHRGHVEDRGEQSVGRPGCHLGRADAALLLHRSRCTVDSQWVEITRHDNLSLR